MAQGEYLLRGSIYNESEFNAGNGACGPTILAAAERWIKGARAPLAQDVLRTMYAAGLCSASGVTNLPKLALAAQRAGLTVARNQPNVGILHFAEYTLTEATVNGRHYAPGVCILEIANGQALTDYLSGQGEDAVNLQYHFIGLVGVNTGGYSSYLGCSVPPGFFAVDGASLLMNPVVSGVGRVHRYINTTLCYYPSSVLSRAQPYDIFAVTG